MITIKATGDTTLHTAGKYCPEDILVQVPSGEDVTDETNAYTAKIVSLESAVAALETELQGKASGGGSSSGEVATCTIEIINESIGTFMESYLTELWFVTYENGELKGYGGHKNNPEDNNKLPTDFDWESERCVLNNVVCGSMMCVNDEQGALTLPLDMQRVNSSVDYRFLLVPLTPNATHTLMLEGWG